MKLLKIKNSLFFDELTCAVVNIVRRFCSNVKDVHRHDKSLNENQRRPCLAYCRTVHLEYSYEACKASVKDKVIENNMNNAEIRDTAKVLNVGCTMVLRILKNLRQENP